MRNRIMDLWESFEPRLWWLGLLGIAAPGALVIKIILIFQGKGGEDV